MIATISNKDLQDKLSGLNLKKNKDYIFSEYDLEYTKDALIFKIKANFDYDYFIYRDKRGRKTNTFILFSIPLVNNKGNLIKENDISNLQKIKDEYISFDVNKEFKEDFKQTIIIKKDLLKKIKKNNYNYLKDKDVTSRGFCRYYNLMISEDNLRVITTDGITLNDISYSFESKNKFNTAIKYQLFDIIYKEGCDIEIQENYIKTKNYVIITTNKFEFSDEILDQLTPANNLEKHILSYDNIKDITTYFIDFKIENKTIRLKTEPLQKIFKLYNQLYFEYSLDSFNEDNLYYKSVRFYNKSNINILMMSASLAYNESTIYKL